MTVRTVRMTRPSLSYSKACVSVSVNPTSAACLTKSLNSVRSGSTLTYAVPYCGPPFGMSDARCGVFRNSRNSRNRHNRGSISSELVSSSLQTGERGLHTTEVQR